MQLWHNCICSAVTVVILVVWYRRRVGSFHVDKNHPKASIEVDNDLYGFTRHQDMDDTKQPGNRYVYSTPSPQNSGIADNPLYGDEHKGVPANNPMHGESNSPADAQETEITYSNVNADTRTIQTGIDSEYSYCKY